MKSLSIKLEPNDHAAFESMREQENTTQSGMLVKLMHAFTSKPLPASDTKALQGMLEAAERANKSLSNDLLDKASDIKALSDKLAEQALELAELREKPSENSDLTADVKELTRLQQVSAAILVYAKKRLRARLRNTDLITEDEAVNGFVESNKE